MQDIETIKANLENRVIFTDCVGNIIKTGDTLLFLDKRYIPSSLRKTTVNKGSVKIKYTNNTTSKFFKHALSTTKVKTKSIYNPRNMYDPKKIKTKNSAIICVFYRHLIRKECKFFMNANNHAFVYTYHENERNKNNKQVQLQCIKGDFSNMDEAFKQSTNYYNAVNSYNKFFNK